MQPITLRCIHWQVTLPGGRNTLCLLPAKFNKKLWIRRGGYLIIDQGEQGGDNRVTGTITAVLYEPDVRALKKLPGVWWASPTALHASCRSSQRSTFFELLVRSSCHSSAQVRSLEGTSASLTRADADSTWQR